MTKFIRNLARLSLLATGLSALALSSTLIFELGGTPVRRELCQLLYSHSGHTGLATGEQPPYTNASMLMMEAIAMRQGRPTSGAVTSSRVIHQYWKTHKIPTTYHSLIASWQSVYPDWTYVLWDDDNNLELVETFFPEWRNAYNALPSDTYRADFARNLYMYVFGGIYADLGSEALAPLEPILAAQLSSNDRSKPIAFLGKMSTSTAYLHSIPTSFMASSSAGHPLWLLLAQDAVDWSKARSWGKSIPGPEYVTGPVALQRTIAKYHPDVLESSLSPYHPLPVSILNSTVAPVVVFSPDAIYPSSWNRRRPYISTATQECVCWVSMRTFDSEACKKATNARWVINYWN